MDLGRAADSEMMKVRLESDLAWGGGKKEFGGCKCP